MLPHRAMMFTVPGLLPRTMSGSMAQQQSEFMPLIATEGYADAQELGSHLSSCWCLRAILFWVACPAPGAMLTSRPMVLLRAMSLLVVLLQLRFVMMSIACVTTRVIGTINIEIWWLCCALFPTFHYPWDGQSYPLFDTTSGELSIPPMVELVPNLRKDGVTPHHGCRKASLYGHG